MIVTVVIRMKQHLNHHIPLHLIQFHMRFKATSMPIDHQSVREELGTQLLEARFFSKSFIALAFIISFS